MSEATATTATPRGPIAFLRSLRPPPEPARTDALMAALEADKRAGLRMAVRARWVALTVVAIFLIVTIRRWDVIYYLVLLGGFALIGWAQVKVGRVGRSRVELALIFCDLALLTVIAVVPNPFIGGEWPPAMQYRLNTFQFFFVLLAGATLAYSWRTFFAYAWLTTALWIGGIWWVSTQPKVFEEIPELVAPFVAEHPFMLHYLDLNNLHLEERAQELIVFLIVAGILAVNGRRTHNLVVQQAEAARGRANLARHFPPSIVDQLAARDEPLGAVREQHVAVLFADIVGFTKLAERQPPEAVVATLRQFHARLEHCVFDHGGTLDKFLGDGMMATFGTPDPSPRDAAGALACAFAMQDAIAAWNAERLGRGEPAIRLSVGLHFGQVVIGDIGSARRLEFTVLGDTVNVANRLEALTRLLDVGIAASGELVEAAKTDGGEHLLPRLSAAGLQHLRGRDDAIAVWTCA
jgi:adenylate cyclase